MRRGIGLVLIGLGTALLVLAPMLKFYAVPRLAVAPLDLNPKVTSDSAGTVTTVLDFKTATEKSNVDLLSTRRTKADVVASQEATDSEGRPIAVYDSLSVVSLKSDPSGVPYLPAGPERYAFDRTTAIMVVAAGANVDGVEITEEMIGDNTVMPLKFPFWTEKKDYSVFDNTIMKGAPAVFLGDEQVEGLSTYKFEQRIDALKVGMQGTQEIWYQNVTLMYVEPITGQVVNGSSQIKQWLKNADGTDSLVIIDGKIGFTPQEVTDSVTQAKANSSKLNLVANVLPVVCLVLGLILLVVGILLVRRTDDQAV